LSFPGGGNHFFPPYACNDTLVEKTAPDGTAIYRTLLSGESDDRPFYITLDSAQNAVVIGTTYSTRFPVTADAQQKNYSGPAPAPRPGGYIESGGDLYLAIISPSGQLVYSTFLGSEGNDTRPLIHSDGDSELDVVVWVGGENFADGYARGTKGSPVLFTFDLTLRRLIRAVYLPAGSYQMTDKGSTQLITPETFLEFDRFGGRSLEVSLQGFRFLGAPLVTETQEGDFWFAGRTTEHSGVVGRLSRSGDEKARWVLPLLPSPFPGFPAFGSPTFYAASLGEDGLLYMLGSLTRKRGLQFTTPNALLRSPCFYSDSFLSVIGGRGETHMLTYLPRFSPRFVRTPTGRMALVSLESGPPREIDFETRPTIGCVEDAQRDNLQPPFGVGQTVRLRGGGFGFGSEGLRVLVGGQQARVLTIAPGELVFPIPFDSVDNASTPVLVEHFNASSEEFRIPVKQVAPNLLSLTNSGGVPNTFNTPANWGSVIHVYLTGGGRFSPELADGEVAPEGSLSRLSEAVSVRFQIAGPNLEAGRVIYAGPEPGMIAGVARIDIELPAARPVTYSSIAPVLTIAGVPLLLPAIYVK
jgi:uncharacterized protein (TIGR03437 family)